MAGAAAYWYWKCTAGDVEPAAVKVTSTGPLGTPPGAVAVQRDRLAQSTLAAIRPKRTTTVPVGLHRSFPVRTTCVPGAPARGETDVSTGPPAPVVVLVWWWVSVRRDEWSRPGAVVVGLVARRRVVVGLVPRRRPVEG
ncbi:MAG TPA: hypothetical protein VFN60_03295 [Acidimicrobiales bacterium]|nr:hypothetical protein [Acidimicrobiales bacterium]